MKALTLVCARKQNLSKYAPEKGGSLSRLELDYAFSDDLELRAGLDIFNGDRNGLSGQFDSRDCFVADFKCGF